MVFLKILALIASFFFAAIIIRFREKLVRTIGKNEWAERYLGAGGTYTMWILIAVLIVVLAAVWLVGLPGR